MSWSIHAGGDAAETKHNIAAAMAQYEKAPEPRKRVIEAAGTFLGAIVEAAPEGSRFSLSIGGHFEESNVLSSSWQTISVSGPAPQV